MGKQAESIRTARLFEFYVKYIWPIHRKLVTSKIAKRCKTCAASEKMLQLNINQICVACEAQSNQTDKTPQIKNLSESKNQSEVQSKQLSQILSEYVGAGKNQYDALGLFSGGKDSTYMLERIRKEHPKIRILAYTIDNGYMSPVAKDNVAEMLQKLKIDHVFVKPDPGFYKKLFKYCLTHLNADGGYGTLDFSDGECMLDTARILAQEKKIPLILCGYSKYQVQNGLKLFSIESPKELERKKRTHTAGIPLQNIFSDDVDLKRWWPGCEDPLKEAPRLLFPLYAWDLEENEIKAKITQWGLLKKEEHSPIVTNHQLIPVIGVVDVHQLGYSSFEPEFCRMIREGKALKSEWQGTFEFLEYTARSGLFVKKIVIDLLAELDLTTDDVKVKFQS